MQITIVCDSLQELNEIVDRMFIVFPEEDGSGEAPEEDIAAKKDPAPRAKHSKVKVDKDKILQLAATGMSAKVIAVKTGNGYSTVCKVLQEAKRK